jgi:PAS domain S-box-containing protein
LGISPRTGLAAVLVGVAYYLGSKLGFALTFQPHPISTLWPPNSLLMVGLLLTPVRAWWLLVLAAFPAHLAAQFQSGVPPAMVLGWFASNCSEALIGAFCIRWFIREPLCFDSFRQVGVFLLFGALAAPLASTFIDAALVKLIGWGEGSYWDLWRLRFFSNVLAALTIVPLVVTCIAQGPAWIRRANLWQFVEAACVLIGLLAVSSLVFKQREAGLLAPAMFYAPLPLLLWATVRLGPAGTSASLLVVVGLAIWGATHDQGPFVTSSPEENARAVQLFLIAISVPMLLLAAVIEERRQANRAIELSEARADRIFRSSPDPIALVRKSDQTLLDVNDKWEAMFGYSRKEAIGRTTAQLGTYVDQRDRENFLMLQARQGYVRDFKADARSRSGEVRHAVMASESAEINGIPCMITTIRDVTEQDRAEREAREQREQITHLTRVAMLGELSGALAHELNQPLTAILSNAQAAQRFLNSDRMNIEELREILRDIADEDRRAGEVISRLRAMFRKDVAYFQALQANELVQDVLQLARGDLVSRGIEVNTRLSPDCPIVLGDRVQLQQVLLNLILNACEAMTEEPAGPCVLSIATEIHASRTVRFSVADSGPGISQEQLKELFQPFFTTKQQGLGLGLSISRSIVNAHHGALSVVNSLGGGAVFYVDLPAQAEVE